MRFLSAAMILIFSSSIFLEAQNLDLFSLSLTPGVIVPIGNSAELFTTGGIVELSGDFTIPFAPFLYGRVGIDAGILPTKAEKNMTLITFNGGAGVQLNPLQKLQIKTGAEAGYYLGFFQGQNGGGLHITGGVDLSYKMSPALALGLGVQYHRYFDGKEALNHNISFYLGTHFKLGTKGQRSKLKIKQIEIDPVFPVFYKYYNDNPVGNIAFINGESGKIEDITVSFFVKKYMDHPKVSVPILELARGETLSMDLKALFNDQILELTTATKVAAQISVFYMMEGKEITTEFSDTIRIFNRNNITWDDDRKAAAFVSGTDPTVMRFSKSIEAVVRDHASTAINDRFRTAMAVFESVRLFGMNYVIDPNSPYSELSQNTLALDYLQFPRQTLDFKAGDCDDLSILYCALLESIGKETAFITIPGHIYTAISLNMNEDDAKRTFSKPEDLIFLDGEVWLPVEITMIDDGFIKAWYYGAKEWRDNVDQGNARLYPVSSAWKTYEPVGMSGEAIAINYPDETELAASFDRELEIFVGREIAPLIETLEQQIQDSENNYRLINRLGVLYARFGLNEKAEIEFLRVLKVREYSPSLLNMGNILYMQNNMDQAFTYYERAYRNNVKNPKALLALAKISYNKGEYTEADKYYSELNRVDSQLADRYTYLRLGNSGISRASQVQNREDVLWDED